VDDSGNTAFHAAVLSVLGQERRAELPLVHSSATGPLIASYNVHKCVGTDKRFDPIRTAAVIAEMDADIVALQEADQRFGDRAGLLDLARLKRENNLVPATIRGPAGSHGWHGNLLLVREGKVGNVHLVKLPGVEPRGALVADIDLQAGSLRIVATHLGLLRRSRAQQAEAILAAVSIGADKPTLIMGDLNEWRLGTRSSLRSFDPTFGPLSAALPSFPSRFPVFALDRILSDPPELISRIEVHATPLARTASDHLPIKAVIDMKRAARAFPPTDTRIAA
jgi:endonuclease/exonuclease/phosphatase family metal-dependent hydrolase